MPRGRPGRPIAPIEERFWKKVDKNGANGCWNWVGYRREDGYGEIVRGSKKQGGMARAHRLSWEIAHGPILAGRQVLHKCIANRACVNPEHLYLGAHKENNRDTHDQDRHQRGGRHWKTKLTDAQVAAIREAYNSGSKRLRDMADEYGITEGGVRHIVSGKNWKHEGCGESEREFSPAPLTDQQILEIRSSFARRVSQEKLARRFGVSKAVIKAIVHYKFAG